MALSVKGLTCGFSLDHDLAAHDFKSHMRLHTVSAWGFSSCSLSKETNFKKVKIKNNRISALMKSIVYLKKKIKPEHRLTCSMKAIKGGCCKARRAKFEGWMPSQVYFKEKNQGRAFKKKKIGY